MRPGKLHAGFQHGDGGQRVQLAQFKKGSFEADELLQFVQAFTSSSLKESLAHSKLSFCYGLELGCHLRTAAMIT